MTLTQPPVVTEKQEKQIKGQLKERADGKGHAILPERGEKRSGGHSYRVLMIAPTMFFADYGCHVRILEEAVALKSLGQQVTILAYPNGRDVAGLDVRRCWGVPFNYRVVVGSSRHRLYLDVLLGCKSLLHVLRHPPDVIHAHLHEGGLMGGILSHMTGVPLVFDFQGSLTGEMMDHNFLKRESLFYGPLRLLEELIDHGADAVLTSSRHASNLLEEEFGMPRDRVHPIPDCVNPNTFTPDVLTPQEVRDIKQRLGIPPGRQVVVYLGVLATYQGTDLLLEAAKLLAKERDDVHYLVMGYPHDEYYRGLAASMGLADTTTFTGRIPYEEAARYLSLGDVAAAPKISDTEGSGKILNYMSMSLPTVAFDAPVSREYLADLGIYAHERTPESLAGALRRALDMPREARAGLGSRLRERTIENYSWLNAGERIISIYDRLCATHESSDYHRPGKGRSRG